MPEKAKVYYPPKIVDFCCQNTAYVEKHTQTCRFVRSYHGTMRQGTPQMGSEIGSLLVVFSR